MSLAGEPAADDEVTKAKASGEYAATRQLLGSREWRLDHLYKIQDENGDEVRFTRNEAQRAYSASMWSRDIIVKARQLGFSTDIGIKMLDTCIFRSNTAAGVIDEGLRKAREKLAKIKFAYNRMPEPLRDAVPLVRENTEELQWANGSKVTVGTSYRGGTLQILHISEMGKIAQNNPEAAREIITGAMRAVHASGWIANESTAHGTAGEFYKQVKQAERRMAEGRPLTPLDFKLHFFGWWVRREYRLANNLVVVPQELRDYFTELALKYRLKLDADQQAWYAKQYADLGPDDMKQEFPSVVDETFFNSVQGAYFQKELTKARKDGRIGQLVPHDPMRRVNTAWDIGEDCTAIVFHQSDGVRHRIIDYYEEEGGSLQSAAAVVSSKREEHGYLYDKHFGPHDIENREWGNQAQTRSATALALGIKFTPVPRIADKADSINAARRLLGLTWIDSVRCSLLVDRLDNYRKKWNAILQVFSSEPVHDMASHGSDAVQQLAMGTTPGKPEGEGRNRRGPDTPKTTSWAS